MKPKKDVAVVTYPGLQSDEADRRIKQIVAEHRGDAVHQSLTADLPVRRRLEFVFRGETIGRGTKLAMRQRIRAAVADSRTEFTKL